MKKMKILVSLLFVFIIAGAITGCKKEEVKTITLGSMSTTEPIVTKLKEHLNKKGFKTETKLFDANNAAAIAAKDGDLTGFVHNHKPWIDTFNKENNSKLTVVKPYIAYYRLALYSTKYKDISELPNNIKIGLANDPSNTDTELKFLNDLGLIKLGDKKDKFYTLLDVKENPKKIKFVQMDVDTVARSAKDVDAVVVHAIRAKQAGLDPNKFLKEDKTAKDFPIGLTVNDKDKNSAWVKEAQKYIASDEFRNWFENKFNGTLVQYSK